MSLLGLRTRVSMGSISRSSQNSFRTSMPKKFPISKQTGGIPASHPSFLIAKRTFFSSPIVYKDQKGDPKPQPTMTETVQRAADPKGTTKAAVVPTTTGRTVVRQPESVDDIKTGISKLLDEEIESVKENALPVDSQSDIIKQFLARTKYEVSEGKDGDIIMKRTQGEHTVTITFNKDEPVEDEMENMPGQAGETENEPAAEEEDEKDAQSKEEGGSFPQKQAVNIEVQFGSKPTKWVLGGFAGKDNRLYIEDMSITTEEDHKKMAEVTAANQSTAPSVDAIPFESLADNLQDRIYDFLDELAVDDQLAHFVKSYTMAAEAQSAVKFLENLKNLIKPTV